jgi:acetylglutamate kinase
VVSGGSKFGATATDVRSSRRAAPVVAPARDAMRPARGTAPAVVVKIGGRACETPGALRELATELATLSGRLLLVHGGGAEVSAWSERLGLTARFVDGLRVTDAPTLEIVAAVLAGLANKRLVAALRAADIDAVGLSALDGDLIEAVRHPDAARLGEVGAVGGVHPALLHQLMSHGRLPVVASLGALDGALLNLNADDVAGALAAGVRAEALVLLSDAPGVIVAGQVVRHLDPASLGEALANPEVQGGMRAKLHAARAALAAGVPRVMIGAWAGPGTLSGLLAGRGSCTSITDGSPLGGFHG